jgi:hypothetical protein
MILDAISRRSRRLTRAVALSLSVAAVGILAAPLHATSASASLLPNCGSRDSATTFARWGDAHAYFLAPGGSFENDAPGWSVGSAKVVAGNETFFANAASDSHNLAIPAGTQVTAPTTCVAMGENSVRFFVKNSGVAGSVLHVQAYVQNPLTGLVLSTGFDVDGSATAAGWAPSARLTIPNLLGGLLGTQNLTLVFSTRGAASTWNIDDVYVDPFKSR